MNAFVVGGTNRRPRTFNQYRLSRSYPSLGFAISKISEGSRGYSSMLPLNTSNDEVWTSVIILGLVWTLESEKCGDKVPYPCF